MTCNSQEYQSSRESNLDLSKTMTDLDYSAMKTIYIGYFISNIFHSNEISLHCFAIKMLFKLNNMKQDLSKISANRFIFLKRQLLGSFSVKKT